MFLDLEAKEASGSDNNIPNVGATEKEIECTAEAETEADVQHEEQPEEADIENAAIDKELNEECEDDAADAEDFELDLGLDNEDIFMSDVEDASKR